MAVQCAKKGCNKAGTKALSYFDPFRDVDTDDPVFVCNKHAREANQIFFQTDVAGLKDWLNESRVSGPRKTWRRGKHKAQNGDRFNVEGIRYDDPNDGSRVGWHISCFSHAKGKRHFIWVVEGKFFPVLYGLDYRRAGLGPIDFPVPQILDTAGVPEQTGEYTEAEMEAVLAAIGKWET
jgi:hypothetical protein